MMDDIINYYKNREDIYWSSSVATRRLKKINSDLSIKNHSKLKKTDIIYYSLKNIRIEAFFLFVFLISFLIFEIFN